MLFRDGTWDEYIWDSVVNKNEYRLNKNLYIDTAIDLGGHIGSFSYRICTYHGANKVLTLEPSPDNFKLLIHNLYEVANLQAKVTLLNSAVSNETKTVILVNNGDPNTGNKAINRSVEGISVPAININTVLNMSNVEQYDLIKMDIEYSEWDVLPTVNNWPERCKYLIGEYHGNIDNFRKLLSGVGYKNIEMKELVKDIGLWWCTNEDLNELLEPRS